MLAELLGVEVAARRERYLTTRTRLAHLPFQRTFEQFDFAFQTSIDERLVKELANLAFVAEATNVLLLGPPGVGKTHLAIALALRAIENGHGAYFIRAYDLMEDLRKARAEHNLDRRMLNIRGESYRLREKRQRGYSPHNNTSPQRRRRPATTTYTDRIAEQQRGGSISTCYKRVSSKLLLTCASIWILTAVYAAW